MPNDGSFFDVVNEIVQEEADGWLDPELAGQLRAVGIVKGQQFEPDDRLKKILADAVAIGNAYARVNTVYPQDEGSYIYHDEHTEWVMAYPDKDTYVPKERRAPHGRQALDALQRRLRDASHGRDETRHRIRRTRSRASTARVARSMARRPTSSACRRTFRSRTTGR